MTAQELLDQAKADLQPTEEQVASKAKELIAEEFTSKQARVTELSAELDAAKASLADTEATIEALEPKAEEEAETPAEEVAENQG